MTVIQRIALVCCPHVLFSLSSALFSLSLYIYISPPLSRSRALSFSVALTRHIHPQRNISWSDFEGKSLSNYAPPHYVTDSEDEPEERSDLMEISEQPESSSDAALELPVHQSIASRRSAAPPKPEPPVSLVSGRSLPSAPGSSSVVCERGGLTVVIACVQAPIHAVPRMDDDKETFTTLNDAVATLLW